ncbi:SGNH/GDSL hydrolase family protein [Citrobacter werkmanii]|uniref:SGNH/GDSL hydrolase family protein n=1 Tax=Citrobacter werkmanii TaxID=67827 RepID=UPI0018FF4DD4|nr:SGNH/GDSL hydrolase family protein [Citrobacter werkmanii]MBJ9294341.1 SGNH/GDSL hydrolase family protein [Citrobacter werkmanii]
MVKNKRYVSAGALCVAVVAGLSACNDNASLQKGTAEVNAMQAGKLTDYGESHLPRLAEKLRHSQSELTHIVFLGDSHTAADFFSGSLRQHFQSVYGDGGAGFISPMAVPGNRYSNVYFQNTYGLKLITSRRDKNPDFTLGGNIVTPVSSNNGAQVVVRAPQGRELVQALYASPSAGQWSVNGAKYALAATGNGWAFSQPVTVGSTFGWSMSTSTPTALAGLMLTSTNGHGVVLSALGINGAQVSMLDKWQNNWGGVLKQLAPDMVILAYGTNEAFNTGLSLEAYRQTLQRQIETIRQSTPDAAILLIGPGSSIMHKQEQGCAQRQPALLQPIIAVQQQVARQERALFWNWFDFMGGDCAIERWAAQGKARPDLIHLASAGYQESANALFGDLSAALK